MGIVAVTPLFLSPCLSGPAHFSIKPSCLSVKSFSSQKFVPELRYYLLLNLPIVWGGTPVDVLAKVEKTLEAYLDGVGKRRVISWNLISS